MSSAAAAHRPRRRRPFREELQILVSSKAAAYQTGGDGVTHAAYPTAILSLCGLRRTELRARRGRGQHRQPTCPTCAYYAEAIARRLAELDEEYERIASEELAVSC